MSLYWGLLVVVVAWVAGITHVLLTTDTPWPAALESGAGLGTAMLLVIFVLVPPAAFFAGGAMAAIEQAREWLEDFRDWRLARAMDPPQKRGRLGRPAGQVREVEAPDRRDWRREDMSHQPHALPERRRRRQRRGDGAYPSGAKKPANPSCRRA